MPRAIATRFVRASAFALVAMVALTIVGISPAAWARSRRARTPAAVPRPHISLLHQNPPGAQPWQLRHPWLAPRAELLDALAVGMRGLRCDACLERQRSAEEGPPGLEAHLDWNRLTTLTLGDTVLRVTNVQPFSLLLRQPF